MCTGEEVKQDKISFSALVEILFGEKDSLLCGTWTRWRSK